MKNIYILLLLLLMASCGQKDNRLKTTEQFIPTQEEFPDFYMSTTQEHLENYEVFGVVDLYNIIPELDDLPISKESFWLIQDAIKVEVEAEALASNYVVISKGENCLAPVGFCEAHILKREFQVD